MALLHALEAATQRSPTDQGSETGPSPVSFALANTSAALAVVSDYFAPGLWPVTVSVLVGSNLGTFRDAAGQLGRGELGLPTPGS